MHECETRLSLSLTGFVADGLCHPELRLELYFVFSLRQLDGLLERLADVQGALLVDEAGIYKRQINAIS